MPCHGIPWHCMAWHGIVLWKMIYSSSTCTLKCSLIDVFPFGCGVRGVRHRPLVGTFSRRVECESRDGSHQRLVIDSTSAFTLKCLLIEVFCCGVRGVRHRPLVGTFSRRVECESRDGSHQRLGGNQLSISGRRCRSKGMQRTMSSVVWNAMACHGMAFHGIAWRGMA